jgi:hypothetical protein
VLNLRTDLAILTHILLNMAALRFDDGTESFVEVTDGRFQLRIRDSSGLCLYCALELRDSYWCVFIRAILESSLEIKITGVPVGEVA